MQAGSLVNGGLLKNSMKRFWPLWLIDILAWGLFYIAPLAAMLQATSISGLDAAQAAESQLEIWGGFLYMVLPITFVGAIIVAVYLNERLFSPQAATFYGALPVRRGTLFGTSLAAGLLPQLAVVAVVALFLLALCASMEGLAPALVGEWLLFALGVTFVMNAIAYTVCHLAGSRPVAVFLYLLVNILSVCIAVAVQLIGSSLLYGISIRSDEIFDWAAPILGIGHYCLNVPASGVTHISWAPLLGYCLAGIALLAVAARLNAHRDMERAGDAVAFSGLRPVLKYLAGICAALLMGSFVYLCAWLSEQSFMLLFDTPGAALLAVAMAAGAFLGVLAAQMVMSKSTHVLKSSWKGGAVLAVASVLLVGACHMDAPGIAGYVPEAADVQSVELRADWSQASTFTSDGGIEQVRALHRQALEYGAALKDGDETLDVRYADEGNTATIDITYHLKNGQLLGRTYVVGYEYDYETGELGKGKGTQVVQAAQEAANSAEAKQSRLAQLLDEGALASSGGLVVTLWYGELDEESQSLTLSGKQAEEFVEKALEPDVMRGNVGYVQLFSAYSDQGFDASVEVGTKNGATWFSYQLDKVKSPATVAWVRKNLPNVKLTSWSDA